MLGITRFEDFRRHLDISPTMLTQRLTTLVANGVLERRPYTTRPLRHEYVLTERGRGVAAVVVALAGWANDPVAPEHRRVVIIDQQTGEEVEPVVIDRRTGVPIAWPRHRFGAGLAGGSSMRDRLAGHWSDRAVS